MDLVSGIVVYVLLWWMVFFMALPFGVRPPDDLPPGHADGAPDRPLLWRKALAATVIGALLWLGVDRLIAAGLFSFRDMARAM